MSDHQWFYQADSLIGTSNTVGPISENSILQAAREGKIKPQTLVSSPTRTQGQWMSAAQIPGLVKWIQTGEAERQAVKDQAARERAEQQKAAAAQRQAEAANRQAAANAAAATRESERQQYAQISHCSNLDTLKLIVERVKGILTSQEVIQYVAVQSKPLVNISPDAMVATNRRLIFYRPKLLGRFEFQDYQWIDLGNAHIQQNMLGTVFFAQHRSGQTLTMDYLPKESGQALYRLAQEREEAARMHQHNLNLEAARAGATQVNVSQSTPAAAPAPTANQQTDVMHRMQTLKSMLDQGFITAADFEARKREILASI